MFPREGTDGPVQVRQETPASGNVSLGSSSISISNRMVWDKTETPGLSPSGNLGG